MKQAKAKKTGNCGGAANFFLRAVSTETRSEATAPARGGKGPGGPGSFQKGTSRSLGPASSESHSSFSKSKKGGTDVGRAEERAGGRTAVTALSLTNTGKGKEKHLNVAGEYGKHFA